MGTDPAWRRRGIARELLAHVAADARNLGAQTVSLEVRAGNEGAQALYKALGLTPVGTRPSYYSDREDALIMQGDLAALVGATEPAEESSRLVAGMELQVDASHDVQATAVGAAGASRPLILAIESSCDETAAAIVDGEGALASDVVASQIDFHARFGGVVPEIAKPQAHRGHLRRMRRMPRGRGEKPRDEIASLARSFRGGPSHMRRGLSARLLWAWRSRRARRGRRTYRSSA